MFSPTVSSDMRLSVKPAEVAARTRHAAARDQSAHRGSADRSVPTSPKDLAVNALPPTSAAAATVTGTTSGAPAVGSPAADAPAAGSPVATATATATGTSAAAAAATVTLQRTIMVRCKVTRT